jgi:PAS domain S-box-containing protein
MAQQPKTGAELIADLRARIQELEQRDVLRAQAERRLRGSEETARGLLEAAPDAMVVIDQTGTVVLANAQAERLSGYPRDELLGAPIERLVPERLRDRHRGHRSMFLGAPKTRPMGAGLELCLQHRDGHEIPVEISLSPFQAGDQLLVSAAIRDATDRIHAQQVLRDARQEAEQTSQVKTDLLAAASHDLRQPLQAARLYLEVARVQPANPELLEKIGACLASVSDLLEKLLHVSKLDAGAVVPARRRFPLQNVLDRLEDEFTPLAEAQGLVLRCVSTRAIVESDPGLLYQALQNLLSNAIRYTVEGRIVLGSRRTGSTVQVQIWDTGTGIPSDQLTNIFRAFHQLDNPVRNRTQAPGAGLGLAVVERLVRLLGHEVRVRSSVGRGSVFELILPLVPGARSRAAASVASQRGAPSPPAALLAVVEDEPRVLEGLRLLLEAAGHQVIAAADQDGVLASLRLVGRLPDAVISDYRLRDGRTGVEVLEAIRGEFGASIPGLILTGDTSLPTLRRIGGEKAFRVLYKPVSADSLARELRTLIG